MASSFNRVILLGNVTRDVEVKILQSGTAVTEIGLAVNERRKDESGNWIEETTFVDVTLWGRTAEIAGEYLLKGSPVLIEGRLKLDTWEKDGKKNSKLRVTGEKMQLIPTGKGNTPPDESSQQETRSRPAKSAAKQQQREPIPAANQDCPF